VFASCLLSDVVALRTAVSRETDPVATLKAEFSELVVDIPARGTIGYLEPWDGSGSVEAQRMYQVARYALAPRAIVLRAGPEFVIVVRGAERAGGDPRLAGYYRVAGFPSGHRVFRRLIP